MASTYSTDLRIELMADGENSTTWGSKTNTNWNMIEQAVAGVVSVAMTDAEYTLSTNNAASDEARNAVITMTGTLTASRNVIVPSVDKKYTFKNSTTGGFAIVVKTSAGTGVTIANGATAQVYCDATNVLPAATAINGLNVTASTGTFALSNGKTLTVTGTMTLAGTDGTTMTFPSTSASVARIDAAQTFVGTQTFSGLIVSNGQVSFPASQNASADANTLDDYEEGTWTPVLTFATPGNLSVAYSNQTGIYTKVGRVVNISLLIVTSTFTHTTASGAVNVTGLPFANNASMQSYFVCDWVGITKANYTQATFEVGASASLLTLQAHGSGQSRATISATDMPSAGDVRFRASGAYHA